MWHKLALFILRFRTVLLALLIGFTALFAFYATKIEISNDSKGAIPTNNPKYQEDLNFKKKFGEGGSMMVIGVQTDRFFSPEFFSAYTNFVHQLEKINHIGSVISVPTAITLVNDSVSEKLQVQKLVPDTGSIDYAQVQNTFNNLPFYNGFLYNKESHAYLMAVNFKNYSALPIKERRKTIQAIKDLGNSFSASQKTEFHYSGLPYIRTEISNLVEKEMKLFLIASFILTGLILFLFFRSFIAVFISLLVVGIGVVTSMGSMVLLGYKITLLTALIPPLVVVIGIPNCVYFLNKYHSEYARLGTKREALIGMVEKMGIVTLLTNLTAAIGFGVFFFTKSVVLQEFGLVAGINIMALFVISLLFIPIMFSYLPAPDVKHTNYLDSKWLNAVLNALSNWAFNYRKTIYIVTVVITIISLVGISRLSTVTFMVDDLPKKEVVYQDMKFFEKNFKGILPLEIVVNTKRKNGAVSLPVLSKISELSDSLGQFSEIGSRLSIAEGVKFANQAFNYGDSAYFTIPDQFGAIFLQPYLRMKPNPDAKGGDLFGQLINSFVDTTKQYARISVNMADVGSKKLPLLLDSIRPIVNEVFDSAKYNITYTGSSIVFLEGSKFIINSLSESLGYAFLMIFGCMIFLFRSGRILLITIIVNTIPLIATAGFMGWANVPIKPSTVLVFSVALGITIDVTIRFLVNFKQDLREHPGDISATVHRTISETGLSIIYTSLILIAGFGVFALSRFDGTKALGYLTSMTLLLAMVINLTLQPALLLWMEKAFNKKDKQPKWMNKGLK